MKLRIFFISLFLVLVLQDITAFPNPQEQTSDSLEDDSQQQQQQTADFEDIEEFSKQLPGVKAENSSNVEEDFCLIPKSVGLCLALIPRFYFNKEFSRCEKFWYGGCGGNNNNYETLEECEMKCSQHLKKAQQKEPEDETSLVELCELPSVDPASENCEAFLSRWTFNSTEGKCVQFIYTGCGATKNVFANKYTCQTTCGDYNKAKAANTNSTSAQLTVEPRICDMPKDSGRCFAYSEQYFFHKENNRCQKFVYGGCGGNENKFANSDDCMKACGGDSPSNEIECSNIECPWNLYTHYSTFGCKAIYDGNACCPTRFDCPDQTSPIGNNSIEGKSLTLGNETQEISEPMCSYKGKSYAIGEMVNEASDTGSCRAGCICTPGFGEVKAKITCASVECPEHFGVVPPQKQGCLPTYKKSSCCADDYYCPPSANQTSESQEENEQKPEEERFKCQIDNSTYYEGQRFYPKKSSCSKCTCSKGFNGTLSEEFCEKIDCGIEIYYSDQLARGCAPVYFQSEDGPSCCPISWECPDEPTEDQGMLMPTTPKGEGEASILPMPNNPPPPAPVKGLPLVLPASPPPPREEISILPMPNSQEMPAILPMPVNETKGKLISEVTADACKLPMQAGDCKAIRHRYYFNNETQKCEMFVYSGCKPNANNFVSLQDCENLCETQEEASGILKRSGLFGQQKEREEKSIILSQIDPCTLPMRTGRCRGFFPRFYFSPEDNSCKSFIYGGCKGNHNNFYSKESCEALCANKIDLIASESSEVDDNSTDTNTTQLQARWRSIDASSLQQVVIEDEDPCILPAQTGPCRASVRRFYYDPSVKYCKRFTYGGCQGNSNNFESLKECDTRCSPNKGAGLPGRPGNRPSPRWRSAPLVPMPSVEQEIAPKPTNFIERCRLPKKTGPCRAHVPSFYYDVLTSTCQSFIYGGCYGNSNQFATQEECISTCVQVDTTTNLSRSGPPPKPQVAIQNPPLVIIPGDGFDERVFCALPVERGACKANLLRYYWNQETHRCVPFVYSGCRGNKNNFLKESDCLLWR